MGESERLRAADDLARRIADCLEKYLHEFGFEPYRYPSGEHKGVRMFQPAVVSLFGADGDDGWEFEVRPTAAVPDPSETGLAARVRALHTHNGAPVTPENLRWAATHEALARSWIFDVLTGLAAVLGEQGQP